MNDDLKWIKKHYGEKMAHLCRELFPTILEEKGKLSELLAIHFDYNKALYDDLISNNKVIDFKNYIYNLYGSGIKKEKVEVNLTPTELLESVGYDLYECHSEEEIQSFKKYYASDERICTFYDGRLDSCYVFFAVKKDAVKIKREDFSKPERQDEYGTSVISIQFTKGAVNTLSIKNRYNHMVDNPDATFGNNLDNIVEGLTESFNKKYNLNINSNANGFEIPKYVLANDGKYYKYNFETSNTYYCPNNIIITNFEVEKLDNSKLLVDDLIIDFQEKQLFTRVGFEDAAFIDGIGRNFLKSEIQKDGDYRIIKLYVKLNDEPVIIKINEFNQIIEYRNKYITHVELSFLTFSELMEKISLPNLKRIGEGFMENNKNLVELDLPLLEVTGNYFLSGNTALKKINLPGLRKIGNSFLLQNKVLEEAYLPKVIEIGGNFMPNNISLKLLDLRNVERVGNEFLRSNQNLIEIDFPYLRYAGEHFLMNNKIINKVNFPELSIVNNCFLEKNESLEEISLPYVVYIYGSFLRNAPLKKVHLPEVMTIGNYFLSNNNVLKELSLPNVIKIGECFMLKNNSLEKIYLPIVIEIGDDFLLNNNTLTEINLPNVEKIGLSLLFNNNMLEKVNIPKCNKKANTSWDNPIICEILNQHEEESVKEKRL